MRPRRLFGFPPRAPIFAAPASSTKPTSKKRAFLPFHLSTLGLTPAEWAAGFVQSMFPVVSLPEYQGNFSEWAAHILMEPQLAPYGLPTNVEQGLAWGDAVNHTLAGPGA